MQSTELLISFSTKPEGALLFRQYAEFIIDISDEVLNFLNWLFIWLEVAVLVLKDVIQFIHFQLLSWELVFKISWYAATNNTVAFERCLNGMGS